MKFSSILFYMGIIMVAILAALLGYPQPTLDMDNDILPMARARMGLDLENDSTSPLKGFVVVITGATAGIGQGMTRALIALGATVVAIGRSERKLAALSQSVSPSGRLVPVVAELSDLESVSKAADEIQDLVQHVDVLINNAGIHYRWTTLAHPVTPQDYDLSFGVNYLSHFLLTERMIPLLRNATSPSVVQVSSSFHWAVDGSELMPQKDGSGPIASQKGSTEMALWRDQRAYANAKLAQVLHVRALQREYPDVHSVGVCPAWVGTNIAGEAGNPFHHILGMFAFPVEGFGLNSLLHAVLQTDYENDEKHHHGDFYYNTLFVVNVLRHAPDWAFAPRCAQLGLRDAAMFLLASAMLFAQKFTPQAHTYESSPETYNVELQKGLFEWSRIAVVDYL